LTFVLSIASALSLSAFASAASLPPHCPKFALSKVTPIDLGPFAYSDANTFKNAIETTRPSDHPGRVLIRDHEQYQQVVDQGGLLFLTHNQRAGFGITPSGEIISLFNHGDQKGIGSEAVRKAIQLGATRLHCWGEVLPRYYERFGFKIRSSEPWSPEIWKNDFIPDEPKPNRYYMEYEAKASHAE
jgi:hypothetical protein